MNITSLMQHIHQDQPSDFGEEMFKLATQLWPMNRSLTGRGVRQTLAAIAQHLPDLQVHDVPSGSTVFDWEIPQEWHVNEAYILTPDGQKICDYNVNNLHLLGYSTPVRTTMTLAQLKTHLYSLPDQPDAIPYITSYYKERWGFCLTHQELLALQEGEYTIVIDSKLFPGHLTYGELLIPGDSQQEVFLSSYVCHPSMANNELSGPVVTTFLAKWLKSLPQRRYSYRIIFIPETIGSITYLSHHKDLLKRQVIAGFNISCVGDERAYSYLPSRQGNTLSDRSATHVLQHIDPDFQRYPWSERGSDERQYCAPGIDLPIASIMRTKYGEYPEYHTSLDTLGDVVTAEGLQGGFQALMRALQAIENNVYPLTTVFGEPQLGKRGLYPTLSTKETAETTRLMMDLITWSDGQHCLLDIAEKCDSAIWNLYPILETLVAHELISLYQEAVIS